MDAQQILNKALSEDSLRASVHDLVQRMQAQRGAERHATYQDIADLTRLRQILNKPCPPRRWQEG